MSLTTSYSNDQGSRIDDAVRSIPKSYLNQQPKTSSYRSFGREIGNYDSKVDSTVDSSKLNTQTGLHHKENISTVLRASLSNENLLEKLSSKQTLKKEPNRIRERQNITQRLAELDNGIENADLDPADIQKLNNPQYVVPYVKEIFANLRETEEKYTPKNWYMNQTQSDINDKMRAILVDWLVDVHLKFKLLPETLFLTINLIDRFLEKSKITRQKLQLVGVAAMLIAAKYEEIYPPEIKEFEYVTDRAYTKPEILDMEGKILSCLNFHLTITSPLVFLDRYAMINKLDEKMLNMARYLLELALVEYKMIRYPPSTLACSAIYLTNKIHKKEAWSSVMRKQADYTEQDLRPCAKDLCMLLQNATKNNLQAVRRKYSSSKFMQAAKIQLDKA